MAYNDPRKRPTLAEQILYWMNVYERPSRINPYGDTQPGQRYYRHFGSYARKPARLRKREERLRV